MIFEKIMDSNEKSLANLTPEKGSRNKRKFLYEFPLDVPVDAPASTPTLTPTPSPMEFPRYEFLEDTLRTTPNELGSPKKQGTETLQDADWDDTIACQLMELLFHNLSATFRSAIKRIVERGYTEEIAERVVLRSGLYHGTKDFVSTIVDGALALLSSEKKELGTSCPLIFEDLNSLAEYTMLEMICVLREVKPDFTVAEAMWCLLICDLNLVHACAVEENLLNELCTLESPKGTVETAPDIGKGSLADPPEAETKSSRVSGEHIPSPSSKAANLEEKSGTGRKGSSLNPKKDIHRQKTFHFEKSYKGRMSKGSFKAKLTAWGSMVLDKTLSSEFGSSGLVMKSTYSKVSTSAKSKDPLSDACLSMMQEMVVALPAMMNISESPAPEPEPSSKTPKVLDYYTGIPYDESLGKHVPQNEKDETILLLISHMQTLQKELQGWSDWANEKVMQAARRLGKDQGELKMLRQEKKEAEKFQKGKHTMEENTVKRLSEMEHALSKASGQVETASSTLRRLEVENAVLRKKMEAAKLATVGSATSLHEAIAREQELLKKCQAWEMEKGPVQEDLSILKREAVRLQQQLERDKKRQNQFKVLLEQEAREKQSLRQQANSLKARRKQLRVRDKLEEDNTREIAEKNMLKCKEDIRKLEGEICILRLQLESSKIEALKRGTNESPKTTTNGVKMERECVMCLTDEMSVVFLPCAHQVLCAQCNVLHGKQGMNDCPSCRTPIKRRITVRFAHS